MQYTHAVNTTSDAPSAYGTITSEVTGKVWLDRNLGASRICTSFDDEECYGDYYQWGREADGHEKKDSTITSTLATSIIDINNGGKFITPYDNKFDWIEDEYTYNGSIRSENWNPCPAGYRVPTNDEFLAEYISKRDEAYNKLKFPSAGKRSKSSGSIELPGRVGYLWSSSNTFRYDIVDADKSSEYRASGIPVRCIADR